MGLVQLLPHGQGDTYWRMHQVLEDVWQKTPGKGFSAGWAEATPSSRGEVCMHHLMLWPAVASLKAVACCGISDPWAIDLSALGMFCGHWPRPLPGRLLRDHCLSPPAEDFTAQHPYSLSYLRCLIKQAQQAQTGKSGVQWGWVGCVQFTLLPALNSALCGASHAASRGCAVCISVM